jgi:hypothetical protein
MEKSKLTSISKAKTIEEIGYFWDSHDFTDFDTDAPDVDFQVLCSVPIDLELYSLVEKQAKKRGVKVETLINLWVHEKLAES